MGQGAPRSSGATNVTLKETDACVAFDRSASQHRTDLQVLAMVNNSHYLYRMTILTAVAALAPAVSHEVLCNSMLPVVISCAKDKVMSQVLLIPMPHPGYPLCCI